MRVFTAVDVEDEQLLDRLEDLREFLDFGFNPVSRQKMHLTLQFFQDIDEEEVEEIKEALQGMDISRFEAEVKGTGVFPSKDRVRVVWAGVDSEKIFDLKQQASQHRVEEDSKHDFHPHITLSRVNKISRTLKGEFRKRLEARKDQKHGTLKVDSVKVFESVHTGSRTDYRLLEEVSL
jgi:2'-5' RNA ligase